jgi:putative transposase
MQVDILKGHVSKDHVHLLVSIPPQLTISRLVQQLKGKSSYRILGKYPEMRNFGEDISGQGAISCIAAVK